MIRTLLDTKLGIRFSNFDLAGTLYLLANLPLLLLAYKTMGRTFVVKLALCTVSNSPVSVHHPHSGGAHHPGYAHQLPGGRHSGGLFQRPGADLRRLLRRADILGLYLSKKGRGFTVGKFSPAVQRRPVYPRPDPVPSAPTAIYSAIYTVFNALFVDRVHQQNITTQVLIVTKLRTWSPSGSWGAEDGPGHHLLDRPRRLHRR